MALSPRTMEVEQLPLTGTCDLETLGRPTGRPGRVDERAWHLQPWHADQPY